MKAAAARYRGIPQLQSATISLKSTRSEVSEKHGVNGWRNDTLNGDAASRNHSIANGISKAAFPSSYWSVWRPRYVTRSRPRTDRDVEDFADVANESNDENDTTAGAFWSGSGSDELDNDAPSNDSAVAGHSAMMKGRNFDEKEMASITDWTYWMQSELAADGVENIAFYDEHDVQDADLVEIEKYWDRLMPTVSYLGTEQVAKIYKALCVAYRAHRGQTRKSGEPFIVHPVEVALLLSGLKMDAETVIAGLLHDTVEDTELTFAQVEAIFGPTVRKIVEGETKVSKLPKQLAFSEHADEQAENLRQMFVAMTDDYRIIIVKLADRLHNMRTLRYMKPEKQIKISRETLDIFAPLAHRMGIWQFKSELEDTAFMYLYPVEYKRLNRRLRQHQKHFRDLLDRSQELLQRRLNSDPTLTQQASKVEVFGRTKELYSLWHKMETKQETNLENIMDVVGLRVVITPKPSSGAEEDASKIDEGVWLCYHVLGLVQHLHGFQPIPTKVKDYISFPKPNGYQSLHTALILDGQLIEVQIRTKMMHKVAEYGMASHWAYTDGKRKKDGSADMTLYSTPWLSAVKEWQNDKISSRDFVDSVRRELLGKRVFVFLRNGKILNLARGATVIDAAFQIHTEVGLKMHGADINGKPVPFSYELQNGDVVSILTGEGRPATDWMRYANSRSTRSKLRSYFRARQRESLREAGKILIMDYLWMHGPLIEEDSNLKGEVRVPTLNVEDLAQFLPGRTQFETVDELLIAIGKNHDRDFLHNIVAQIFEVPKNKLVSAEERRSHRPKSGGVLSAVLEGRRLSKAVADLLASSVDHRTSRVKRSHEESQAKRTATSHFGPIWNPENWAFTTNSAPEFADPEHLCTHCLPIHGDAIVGTRRSSDKDPASTIATVHRVACPHAQKALIRGQAEHQHGFLKPGPKIDSVSLREYSGSRRHDSNLTFGVYDIPVRLEWCDFDKNAASCLAEIVVVAEDRRLLLADCSEVVSETVEIVKSGSYTTDEHAMLVYLVQVNSLDHVQSLMDKLGAVRSVMSVERRFGSALLQSQS